MPRSGGKKPTFPGLYSRHLNEMNTLMRTLDPRLSADDEGTLAPMDVYETEDAFVIEFDLPGVSLEGINLTQRGALLVIEVVKDSLPPEGEVKYICLERQFGRFRRTVRLPETVDGARVVAFCKKGVLRIFCPKGSDRRIQIQGE
jgi:HSP20 family protein